MSTEKQYQAADLRGPVNVWISTATSVATGQIQPRQNPPICEIVALLVASGVSQQFDLTQTGMFGSTNFTSRFVRLISETAGNIHYAWQTQTGVTIDRNATGGGTGVAAFLPSLTYSDELPGGQYLAIQPATGGIVRLWITNRTDN